MFRCSECGTEYSVKPDYCDCGNDTFIEIEENIEILESEEEEPKPKKKVRKTFDEQYPWFEDFKQSLDPLSVIFFCICIILSVCLLIFVKPEDTTTTQQAKPKVEKEKIEVANIESFWNDTPPKEVKKTQTVISQIQQPTVVVQPKQPTPQPKINQQITKKPVKNFIQNNIVKKTQTPKTTTTPKTTQNKVTTQTKQQTKTVQTKNTTAPKQVTQVKQNTTQTTTKPTVQVQQPKPITITQNIQVNSNTQELKNYKNNLRNTITSKIDFENIYGDGKCTVTFKIDSNGKLTNKSFSKQSSNGTLNDEVYSAIMSTPKYKTPPTNYNGQMLYFSVEFKNGTYRTTLN